MKMTARSLASVLVIVLALVMVPSGPAYADDHRDPSGVTLLTNSLPAVLAGDSVWVNLSFVGGSDRAEDVRVVVTKARDVEVSYPANTGDHSSLYTDAALDPGEIDFASIRISVPYDAKKAEIEFAVTYVVDGKRVEGVHRRGDKLRKKVKLKIPVKRFNGADVAAVDAGVQTVEGEGGWIDVVLSGQAPLVERVTVRVVDSAGLAIVYPQVGFTSLEHDDRLEDGETDVARFYVDATGATPGRYDLAAEVRWSKAGQEGSMLVPVTVELGS